MSKFAFRGCAHGFQHYRDLRKDGLAIMLALKLAYYAAIIQGARHV